MFWKVTENVQRRHHQRWWVCEAIQQPDMQLHHVSRWESHLSMYKQTSHSVVKLCAVIHCISITESKAKPPKNSYNCQLTAQWKWRNNRWAAGIRASWPYVPRTHLPMWGCCAAASAYCCCWAAVNCCTARALFLWNSCERHEGRWITWIS